jgi:GntR family transcriptional regulator
LKLALRVDPADAVPIWRQIEEGVRRLAAAGLLKPGGAVPSVRDLAKELRVNPATVAKAYQRLCEAGVLEVRRGEGTFVAQNPPSLKKSERRGALREGALRFASLAVTLGSDREEAMSELESAWAQMGDRAKGGRP